MSYIDPHFRTTDIGDDDIRPLFKISVHSHVKEDVETPEPPKIPDSEPESKKQDIPAPFDAVLPTPIATIAVEDANPQLETISRNKSRDSENRRTLRRIIFWVLGIIAMLGILVYIFLRDSEDDEELQITVENVAEPLAVQTLAPEVPEEPAVAPKPYVVLTDTVINGVSLSIFEPCNATPVLSVGAQVLEDSTAVFVAQAADIRRDNGEIVGSYVVEGELISRGQSKSGFCAIVAGNVTVGVADATPYLEKAIEADGYFFRQFPLVVGRQLVENRQTGKSLRKALAELNGSIVVVMSKTRLSFHDFSQALVDLGVSNAIYLVGSTSHGFAKDFDGKRIEFGKLSGQFAPKTNYIVWK